MVRCDCYVCRSDDVVGGNPGPNHLSSIWTTALGQRDIALADPWERPAVYDVDRHRDAEGLHETQRCSSPTLKLLQVHGLYISSRQILHMSKERIGILLSLRWEPRNEFLEVRIGP